MTDNMLLSCFGEKMSGEALANRRQFIRGCFGGGTNVRPSISCIAAAAALDLGLGEFARQPVQSLVETVTLGRARRLDVPLKNRIIFEKEGHSEG